MLLQSQFRRALNVVQFLQVFCCRLEWTGADLWNHAIPRSCSSQLPNLKTRAAKLDLRLLHRRSPADGAASHQDRDMRKDAAMARVMLLQVSHTAATAPSFDSTVYNCQCKLIKKIAPSLCRGSALLAWSPCRAHRHLVADAPVPSSSAAAAGWGRRGRPRHGATATEHPLWSHGGAQAATLSAAAIITSPTVSGAGRGACVRAGAAAVGAGHRTRRRAHP